MIADTMVYRSTVNGAQTTMEHGHYNAYKKMITTATHTRYSFDDRMVIQQSNRQYAIQYNV